MKTIILASTSPRRKTLLEKIGLKFIVYPNNYKEIISNKLPPAELAEELSLKKALTISKKYENAIIIAADTLVIFKKKIFGKPRTEIEAKKMLKTLSGKMHYVITGYTIYDTSSKKSITKSIQSKVYLRKITNEEIDDYIKTKEPFDKAGGYGVQERGGVFIKKIDGDFFNVVGLPIYSLAQDLKKLNVKI